MPQDERTITALHHLTGRAGIATEEGRNMTRGEIIIEALAKVTQHLGFAGDDLRVALNKASGVEAIIILDLIKHVSDTHNAADRLINAITGEE